MLDRVSVARTARLESPLQAAVDARPRLRRGTVRRDRLVRRLVLSSEVPFVVLSAPAGYGKSTLLCQWAERDERDFVWIEPGAVPAGAALAHAANLLEEAVPDPAVVVVDGADVQADSDAVQAWTRVLPAGSQLAIATRGEPSLPLGSLRAQGLLVELGPSELAMTRTEAAATLSMAAVELDAPDLAALLRHTEGWPAALYLAALSIRADRDPHRAVTGFGGDDRLVTDYLRDEILTRLGAPAAAFLLRT
jgi:LuxR family maltose regulon positive regulatory protein